MRQEFALLQRRLFIRFINAKSLPCFWIIKLGVADNEMDLFMRKIALLLFIVILIPACKKAPLRFNGYIDADLTYLSSNYAGRLCDLAIHRGQSVKKNQFLFKLEQTSERYSVSNSQLSNQNLLAQRQQIVAQLNYAQSNYQRTLRIRKENAASQNDLEAAQRDVEVLKNQLLAIDAQVKSSEVETKDKRWQVQRKEGFAPDAGIIFDTFYNKDEYVQAGQPVLALITKPHIKVMFFVPEKILSRIRLNQSIKITSDGNPDLATGHVNYISNIAQYTPPIIYSREDRSALVFRIEAQVDSPDLEQIHLGQPVTLELSE